MLVAPLVLLLSAAVVQVVLLLHLRASLTAAAAEGARAAALAGASPLAGRWRALEVAAEVVAPDAVRDVRVGHDVVDGLPVVVVRLRAEPDLVGLLPGISVDVSARALVEDPDA